MRGPQFSVGKDVSNPELAAAANGYAARMGQRRPSTFQDVVMNPAHARRIASAYMDAPDFDPRAVPSFRAMADETAQQFDYMTRPRRRGGLGISVDVTPHDPYASAADAFADLRDNRHLSAFSTAATGGHPYFTNDENDMFRLVHDTFGHAATGRGFDRHGEEAAYRSHAAMYSPLARTALATETRGQNSALTQGPMPGVFQDNKIARIAPAMRMEEFTNSADRDAARAQAQQFHEQVFGR